MSLPHAVDLVDGAGQGAYLGHVIVLWSWALKQPGVDGDCPSTWVRFRSPDGRDRAIEVPNLMFTEPITLAGALS